MFRYRKPVTKKRKALILVAVLIVVGGGLLWYFKARQNSTVTNKPSTSQEEDSQAAEEGESQKNPGSEQASGNDKQNSASPSGNTTVASPQGNFVSNHTSSSTSPIESICTTTAGATCDITFTSGGVTKSLGAKTTNNNGTASWYWTPASVGLTPGTWQIKATATLGSAQSSATDPRSLVVTS